MTPFSRQKFLQWSAAGAGVCALGLLGGPARAALSGRKVLEIFMRGGCEPWRSFYRATVNNAAEPTWSAFAPGSSTTAIAGFTGGILGRAAHPLAATTLATRCRVICVSHDILPHEVATPFALTGTRLGRPIACGFGTAVNATANDPLASVVIDTGDAVALSAATQLGGFSSPFRPLVLKMGDTGYVETLERGIASRTNELKRVLNTSYSQRLIPSGGNARVRSAGFDAYDGALDRVRNSAETLTVVSGLDLSVPASPTFNDNATRRAIRVAVQLLAAGRVQYACVIDKGIFDTYDTHNGDVEGSYDAATNQAGNLWSVCSELAAQETQLNTSGVMTMLNTEFGRLNTDGDASGTEHWPAGYVNVFMSDTIPSTQTRGTIAVNTSDVASADAAASYAPLIPYSPAEMRAVLAGRMGVTPSSIVDLSTLAASFTDGDIPSVLNARILR